MVQVYKNNKFASLTFYSPKNVGTVALELEEDVIEIFLLHASSCQVAGIC